MSINITTTPTSFTVTGGTTAVTTLVEKSDAASRYAFLGNTDFRTRKSILMRVKRAKVSGSAPNGYTQQRTEQIHTFPIILANGKLTNGTVTITASFDVEVTAGARENAINEAITYYLDPSIKALHKDMILPVA